MALQGHDLDAGHAPAARAARSSGKQADTLQRRLIRCPFWLVPLRHASIRFVQLDAGTRHLEVRRRRFGGVIRGSLARLGSPAMHPIVLSR